jgi:hypothetical protein
MSGLVCKIEEAALSGTFVDASCRLSNTSGTPVVSAVSNGDGGAIAGVYSLTFDDSDPAVDATVKVNADSPNNPNIDSVGKTVLLDGTTIYKNVLRGVDLVFDDDAGFLDTWTAQIKVGLSFGAAESFGASAGIPGTSRKVRVENTGSESASNCIAELVNIVKHWAKVGTIFARVFPFAESATEKLTDGQVSPYAITVENVTGSDESKIMDVLFDGSLFDVINLTDSSEGTSEGLNVVDRYRITSGSLQDVEFLLSEDAEDSSTANILIFSTRFMQIAPDESGSPGTFGTADIDLTESGQATGTITAGGFADFHVRILVTEGGNSLSNPYPLDVRVSGLVSSGAGWSDD